MKKTLIAATVAVAVCSFNARADIVITQATLPGKPPSLAGGEITNAGNGTIFSIDPFWGIPWTAVQQTTFMDNTGSWNGISPVGGGTAFDYDVEIASMTDNQVAVGLFWNWNTNNGVAVLEIFDCISDVCMGQGVPMATGPFPGIPIIFNGTGSATVPSAIPVPAAMWLMLSGIVGLIGFSHKPGSRVNQYN